MVEKEFDILIIGGGLTGATLLLALAGKELRVLLVDSKPLHQKVSADFDARSIALSPASVRILRNIGVWSLLEKDATPIHHIHISDQHRFGAARLQAKPNQALGYVVEVQHINRVLHHLLNEKQVLAPAQLIELNKSKGTAIVATDDGKELAITAKLIVAADGTDSTVRKLIGLKAKNKNYQQHAIVANIELSRSHHNKAYERFTSSGPLALLPMTENRVSLVWALAPQQAERLLKASEKEFLKALQEAFGYRLGRFLRSGKRMLFPLQQVLISEQTNWPFVFVGNAAHTLHPVAGQGFNLGLRDVATLAQCILRQGLNAQMLQQYVSMRQHDQKAIVTLTDGLVNIFTSRLPGLSFARNLGLIAIDNLTALKKILSYYTRGFGGVIPDLVCGIDPEDAK